jgi:hypothetical protein
VTSSSPQLREYRAAFFKTMAEEHDQEIEWNLPSWLPYDYENKSHRSLNPSGFSLGPPAGRSGMTTNGS